MIEQELLTQVKTLTSWDCYLNHAIENQQQPYVVLSKVSAPRGFTLTENDGTVESTFRINVYSSDYRLAKLEAQKIYALNEYSSSTVAFITLDNETDLYEADTSLHHVVLSFGVFYYE